MAQNSLIRLKSAPKSLVGNVVLPISKSLSNRALVLKFLLGEDLGQLKISSANDSQLLLRILLNFSHLNSIDVHDAGTVARFTLAICAVFDNKERTISGTERMHQRPVKPLVDALKQLGGKIQYLGKEGFLPLTIQGTNTPKPHCDLEPSLSSQFLTALLLIAPKLSLPFCISLSSQITSRPYAEMTFQLLKLYGYKFNETENHLTISKPEAEKQETSEVSKKRELFTEGDWSAAIYLLFFNILIKKIKPAEDKTQSQNYASPNSIKFQDNNTTQVFSGENNPDVASAFYIENLLDNSLQGDRYIEHLLLPLGIKMEFSSNGVTSLLTDLPNRSIELDFSKNPDLAQPFACYMVAKKLTGKLSGLQTLKHKETDRIEALKNELSKVGADVQTDNSSLKIKGYADVFPEQKTFRTYNDHRMAMSLALVQIVHSNFEIENPVVVSKSFPDFWKTLEALGFEYEIV